MSLKAQLLTLSLSLSTLAKPQQPEDFQTYTVRDPAQLSRISSRMQTFEASLTRDPKYSSIMSVGETAFPATLNWDEVLAPGKTMTTESWYQAMPSDVKSWWFSVASEERKFITDTSGPEATAAAKGSSAGAAAGSAAGASVVSSAVSSAASSAASSASASVSSSASSAKATASQTGQKAANTTSANAAEVGDARFAQAMAVGVAGLVGVVALLL